MGLRFRKIVRLAPGIRLNVSKRGLSSLSFGGKGLTYNIGRKGTRGTIGKPGSGLSYSHYEKHEGTAIDRETGEIRRTGLPWPWVVAILLVILGIYFWRMQG